MQYPDSLPDTPGAIMARLAVLEREVALLEPDWGQAEAAYARTNERKKLREAQLRFTFKGWGTVEDINARVRDAMWTDPEGYMQRREEADATRVAKSTRHQVLQTEMSSLKARLEAMVKGGGG